VLLNYTFGKSIDEVSDDNFNPVDLSLADSYNRRPDRAVSSGDIRHVMNLSYVWDLPRLKNWNPVARSVLGAWQLNGIISARSGNPVNIVSGRDINLDGRSTDRPNLVGTPVISGDRSRQERIRQFFDTSAFIFPATGAIGTAGRNLFYGPGSLTWDAVVMKHFPIRENHRLTVRGEFFNVTNRVNLNNPVSSLNDANFGRILSAGGARVVQLALRYGF
jgi:hypothetical protein